MGRLSEWLERSGWWPLAYCLFVCGFFFIPASKLHNNFYYAGLLLPALLCQPLARVRRCWPSRLYRLALALILWLALSNLWLTAPEFDDFRDSLFHGLYMAVFLTLGVDLLHRDPGFRPRLVGWLALTVGVCAPLSMAWFYPGYLGGWIDSPDGRLQGLGRVDHSGLAATCYGVAGWLAYLEGVRGSRGVARRYWIYAVLASLAFVVLAGSRGAWLALIGSVALLVGLRHRVGLWILVGAPLLGYLLLVATGTMPLGTLAIQPGGDSYRLAIWYQSLGHWLEAPWLGHGLGAEFAYDLVLPPAHPVVNHPHNAYLGTALHGGLVALVLLLVLLGGALYRNWRAGDDGGLATLVLGALFMVTDGSRLIDNPQPFWVYFWLPLALATATELRERAVTPAVIRRTAGAGSADAASCAKTGSDPGAADSAASDPADTPAGRPDR